jgi:hypothetical protein
MKVVLAIIALLILFPVQISSQQDTQLTEDVLTFNEQWNVFYREYFGCPMKALVTEECVPMLGRIDYKAFLSARRAAKKLFELEDRKK